MKKQLMFNEKPLTLKRVVVYLLGLFVMALGIAFAINSQFGVSPVTTLPYVAGRILGVSVGLGTIAAFILFIIFQICVYRKHYKPIWLLQFVMAIIFGYYTDFTKWLISPLGTPETVLMKVVWCFIGINFVAIGLRAYLTADIMQIPSDGVPVCLAWATGKPLHKMKRAFDIWSVCVSLALSYFFFGDHEGLWIGTVMAAVGVGTVLKPWSDLFQKPLERFLYGDGTEKEAAVDATKV